MGFDTAWKLEQRGLHNMMRLSAYLTKIGGKREAKGWLLLAFVLLGDYWSELRYLCIICPHLSYLWNAGGCCFFLHIPYTNVKCCPSVCFCHGQAR